MARVTSIPKLMTIALATGLLLAADARARDRDEDSASGPTARGTRGDRPADAATRVYAPPAAPDVSVGRRYSTNSDNGPTIAPARRSWTAPPSADLGRAAGKTVGQTPVIRDWSAERPQVSLKGEWPRTTTGRTYSNWRTVGASNKSVASDSPAKVTTSWRTMGADRTSARLDSVRRGTNATASHLAAGGFFRDRRPITRLPEGAKSDHWGGHTYHHHGHHWWRPWWFNGCVYYYWVYPPIGYYYTDLPGGCVTILIGGGTYYFGDGVYYGTAPGREGYVVAEPPGGLPASEPGADQPTPPQAPDENPPMPLGQPEPTRAPDPYEVLKQMADSLSALPRLTLVAGDSFEDIAGNERTERQGQFTLFLRRPDKFALQYRGDMYDRNVIYDGTGATLLNLRKNFFWRAAMPGTIPQALATLARDYRVSMPLAELVVADYDSLAAAIQGGKHLGFDTVGERTYHHLGFSEAAVDWEVWIEADGPAIPRRYAVTYKQLPGQPRYVATVLSWDTGPVADSCFQLPAQPVPVPQ